MKRILVSMSMLKTMFTIEIEDDCLPILRYTNDDMDLCLYVDNINCIGDFDLETDTCLSTDYRRGICYFRWDVNRITFGVSNHTGDGGSLTISFRNTPEIMESLKQCMEIWKKTVEDMDQA